MPLPMKPIVPIRPATQVKPAPSAKPSVLKSPLTITGIRILKGGLKVEHTLVVTDHSGDSAQFLPYQVHCNTCGFESKSKEYDTALSMAKGHVGA